MKLYTVKGHGRTRTLTPEGRKYIQQWARKNSPQPMRQYIAETALKDLGLLPHRKIICEWAVRFSNHYSVAKESALNLTKEFYSDLWTELLKKAEATKPDVNKLFELWFESLGTNTRDYLHKARDLYAFMNKNNMLFGPPENDDTNVELWIEDLQKRSNLSEDSLYKYTTYIIGNQGFLTWVRTIGINPDKFLPTASATPKPQPKTKEITTLKNLIQKGAGKGSAYQRMPLLIWQDTGTLNHSLEERLAWVKQKYEGFKPNTLKVCRSAVSGKSSLWAWAYREGIDLTQYDRTTTTKTTTKKIKTDTLPEALEYLLNTKTVTPEQINNPDSYKDIENPVTKYVLLQNINPIGGPRYTVKTTHSIQRTHS